MTVETRRLIERLLTVHDITRQEVECLTKKSFNLLMSMVYCLWQAPPLRIVLLRSQNLSIELAVDFDLPSQLIDSAHLEKVAWGYISSYMGSCLLTEENTDVGFLPHDKFCSYDWNRSHLTFISSVACIGNAGCKVRCRRTACCRSFVEHLYSFQPNRPQQTNNIRKMPRMIFTGSDEESLEELELPEEPRR